MAGRGHERRAEGRLLHRADHLHGGTQRDAGGAGGDLRPRALGDTVRRRRGARRQANETRYGLAAGIWTRDIQRAHRVAHALSAGTVWVNSYRTLSYNAPYGGYKMSGIGRENGLEGLNTYLQTKSVWMELTGQSPATRSSWGEAYLSRGADQTSTSTSSPVMRTL